MIAFAQQTVKVKDAQDKYAQDADVQNTDVQDADAQRMQRVAQGETEAFIQLFDKHYAKTVRVVTHLMGDSTQAEDLAQVVFMRAFEARHRYVASAKFSTWWYAIVRNVVLNAQRNQNRHHRVLRSAHHRCLIEEREHPATIDPLTRLERRETRHHVKQILTQLCSTQQRAMELVHFRGFSYREAAAEMKVSLPAIKLLLHRGKRTLRERVLRNPDRFLASPSRT